MDPPVNSPEQFLGQPILEIDPLDKMDPSQGAPAQPEETLVSSPLSSPPPIFSAPLPSPTMGDAVTTPTPSGADPSVSATPMASPPLSAAASAVPPATVSAAVPDADAPLTEPMADGSVSSPTSGTPLAPLFDAATATDNTPIQISATEGNPFSQSPEQQPAPVIIEMNVGAVADENVGIAAEGTVTADAVETVGINVVEKDNNVEEIIDAEIETEDGLNVSIADSVSTEPEPAISPAATSAGSILQRLRSRNKRKAATPAPLPTKQQPKKAKTMKPMAPGASTSSSPTSPRNRKGRRAPAVAVSPPPSPKDAKAATDEARELFLSQYPLTPGTDNFLRYQTFSHRDITGTRYLCKDTCQTLNLLDSVKPLLENVGIYTLVTEPQPTHLLLVYELLTTLSIDEATHIISYSLGGTPRSLTMAEFRRVFSLPDTDIVEPVGYDKVFFWKQITGSTWMKDKAKANEIYHPILRIVHRAVFSSLLSRGDSSTTVREADLKILYAMCHPVTDLDIARFMLDHWLQLAEGRLSCAIAIGGYISKLADFHAIPAESRGPTIAHLSLNFLALKKMQVVALLPGTEEWGHPSPKHTLVRVPKVLPYASLLPFQLTDSTTWLLPALRQLAFHGASPAEPVAAAAAAVRIIEDPVVAGSVQSPAAAPANAAANPSASRTASRIGRSSPHQRPLRHSPQPSRRSPISPSPAPDAGTRGDTSSVPPAPAPLELSAASLQPLTSRLDALLQGQQRLQGLMEQMCDIFRKRGNSSS